MTNSLYSVERKGATFIARSPGSEGDRLQLPGVDARDVNRIAIAVHRSLAWIPFCLKKHWWRPMTLEINGQTQHLDINIQSAMKRLLLSREQVEKVFSSEGQLREYLASRCIKKVCFGSGIAPSDPQVDEVAARIQSAYLRVAPQLTMGMVQEREIRNLSTLAGRDKWQMCPLQGSGSALVFCTPSDPLLGEGGNKKVYGGVNLTTGRPLAASFPKTPGQMFPVLDGDVERALASIPECALPNLVASNSSIQDIREQADGDMLNWLERTFAASVMPIESDAHSCMQILRQIASRIQKLHEKDIVHRDIKPENILCRQERGALRIWITDFDYTCKTLNDKARHRDCGTVDYAAPELFSKEEFVQKPVDIFALGRTFYVLCMRNKDICGDSQAVPYAKAQFRYRNPVAWKMMGLIESMVDPDPEKRPTIQQVARELSQIA